MSKINQERRLTEFLCLPHSTRVYLSDETCHMLLRDIILSPEDGSNYVISNRHEIYTGPIASHPWRIYTFFKIDSQYSTAAIVLNTVTLCLRDLILTVNSFPFRTAKLKKRVKCAARSCYPSSSRYWRPRDIFPAPTHQHRIDFDSIAIWTSRVELFLLTANWCLVRLVSTGTHGTRLLSYCSNFLVPCINMSRYCRQTIHSEFGDIYFGR
jgi:hypothetical protein